MIEGFQNTDFGYIPIDWKFGRIDDFFSIQQGKSVSKANRIGNNQKPFLRTSNLLWGRVTTDELDYLHFTAEEENKFQLQYNDLLVCEGGDIGRTAIWKNELEGCYYQNHLHRVRAKLKDIDPVFVLNWMQYAFLYGKVYFGRANITTIPNLSKSRLAEFTIPKPPLPEQLKIAYILSTIQKAIEQQDKLIKTTTELKKALMQKLFTEGLHGEPQKETEIGLVPESWEVVKLGGVCDKAKGGGTPSTKNLDYWNGDIYWTTSKWLNKEKIFLDDGEKKISKQGLENSSSNLLPENNLLISTRVVIGKVAVNKIPIAFSQDLTGLWLKRKIVNPIFLAYQIQAERVHNYLQSLKRGATIQGITREDLVKSLIVLPSIKEQNKIANALELTDRKIEINQKKKQTLTNLFKTLLYELMTGQRRVKEVEFEEMGKVYEIKEQPVRMAAEKI